MKKVRFLTKQGSYITAVFLLFFLFFSWGCGKEKRYERSVMVMDTVVVLSAEGENARRAVDESIEWLKSFDAVANPAGEDSDVVRLGDMAGRGYVRLHPDVYRMLEFSQAYSRLTEGAWDVTTEPLTKLWGIGTANARLPSEEEIREARKLVGWQHLHLRPEDMSAMLEFPGMSVSFGGIAKGYALDEVRRIYEKHGVESGLINMGSSSMYAVGKRDGRMWNIGIRHPRKAEDGTYLAVIPLSDEALSTSGDYERVLEIAGKRYHHIMDPGTGYPADSGVMSVTVVIGGDVPNAGMLSDLLTTAVFVMGPEKGKAFLASLPDLVQGAIVDQNFCVHTSHCFRERMKQWNGEFHFAP